MQFLKNTEDFKSKDFFIFLPKSSKLVSFEPKLNVNLEDLLEITEQKKIILNNTEDFLNNKTSNNILLWGAKGMGKSSLIKL